MEPIKLNYTEFLAYAALINSFIGLLLGLIPLITGITKKQKSLGVYGFIGSIIGGAILGILLSIPIVSVVTYMILKRSKTAVQNSDNAV